jgi:predicted DNA-binding transcriptional regulator YafY
VVEAAGTPVVRALRALEVLQQSPGIRAERLAERLGVSERAVRRYVGMLRDAGIPIESERGPYGGYRIGRGVRLPPLTFSAAEALGLVMAVLDRDPSGPVGSALEKLLRALPESLAGPAEAVRRATAAAPDRVAVRPDPEITTALVKACADRRRVRIEYRSAAGNAFTVDADPWALVVRHGRWYLLCEIHREPGPAARTYRVDRIAAVAERPESFTPPEFDAVAMLEEHLSVGWEYATEVHLLASHEELAGRLPRPLGRLTDEGTGCRLVGSTSDPWWYAEQLAGLRVPFRVAGGAELLACTREMGARLLAACSQEPYSFTY